VPQPPTTPMPPPGGPGLIAPEGGPVQGRSLLERLKDTVRDVIERVRHGHS
jgi:hypothetical protein